MHVLMQSLLRAQTYSFRGRLVADPQINYLASGTQVASARMAIDHPEKKGRDDDKQPDWLSLKVWFEAAETFANGAKKGQLIDVTGRVYFESWTDKNTGEPRQGMALKVHGWAPVETGSPAATTTAPTRTASPATAQPAVWDTGGPVSDEEVPF
jgi:single stranded DNA-binding protein